MNLDELSLQFNDIQDLRQLLSACSTYFTARDLLEAQVHFSGVQKSSITLEIERMEARLEGYVKEFLLEKHEREELEDLELDELKAAYDEELEDDEEPEISPEEALSGRPFGTREFPKQKGRVVTREELLERETDDSDAVTEE